MAEITSIQAHKEKHRSEPDPKLTLLLEGLREYVDNIGKAPNVALRGGIFRGVDLTTKFQQVNYDGILVAYRLHIGKLMDLNRAPWYKIIPDDNIYTREVLVRFEQAVKTIPEDQKDPIVLAVFEVFLMEGQGEVGMETFWFGNRGRRNSNVHDCLRITQEFSPLILTQGPSALTHIKFDDSILEKGGH